MSVRAAPESLRKLGLTGPHATEMEAGHFRRTLRRAERQLLADRPGLVHIGIEATGEARVDRERLMANLI